jgi:hypothetical protein
MDKLIFWEMNEINFEYVNYYIKEGKLPNWKSFIEKHGLFTTTSEEKYEELEPWIQWPTVRTGLDYSDHKVFRLGDIESSSVKQHWELLEEKGFSVAALSPINGANRTKNSPFWIPDPWVDTKISGSGFIERIAKAVAQAVNDNAQEKLDASTFIAILEGLLTKTQLSSWPQYISGVFGAVKKQHWSKAIVLDRLLADVFIYLWKKHEPDFSTLFLNSGAHIQHHYMCSSAAYNGEATNPEWYLAKGKDPLLEILELYDNILGEFNNLENTRLMISIGLKQIPYEKPTFYWRIKNHSEFLNKLGINHKRVQPRMTRDFLIEFNNLEELKEAEIKLSKIVSSNNIKMFEEIDNRGNDLFVTLTYPDDIDNDSSIYLDEEEYKNFKDDVVFVAIKNGHHHTQGYYLDSYRKPNELEDDIPLKNLFTYTMDHFISDVK